MRWHIVVSLGGVNEQPVAVRHESGKEFFQIPPHVGIGILLDEQRGRRVAHVQSHQAIAETPPRYPVDDFVRELVEPTATGRNFELMKSLVQHDVITSPPPTFWPQSFFPVRDCVDGPTITPSG